MGLLTFFRTIETASLLATIHSLRIEDTANDMVSNTWKILHTTTADKHNRVLLKIVSFSWNIGCYFHSIGKTHLGDLTKSGVWLLWSRRGNFRTNTTLLRTSLTHRHVARLQRVEGRLQCR